MGMSPLLSINYIYPLLNQSNIMFHHTEIPSSKVLLVCVYDTIVFEISEHILKQRFGKFGYISKILIFDKKQITKLFIEYDDEQAAINAKQALDGTKLYDSICKMSIYYSNLESVDVSNSNIKTEVLDDLKADKQILQISPIKNIVTNITPTKDKEDNDFYFQRSKTDNFDLVHHIENKSNNIWGLPLCIDDQIQQDIDSILNEQTENSKFNFSISSIESSKKIPQLKSEEVYEQNMVLGFIMKQKVTPKQLYNLFSNFGNVSKIIVTKKNAKIKFKTKEFAAIAYSYLNNLYFFNNQLSLIFYPNNACLPVENEYCEMVCYDEFTDRFTSRKSITINPPSTILHVSGMKRELCCVPQIRKLFKFVCEPIKTKILKQSYEKNMCLIKFPSLEQSLKVVGECHNMMVGSRRIQISFTKSEI